MGNIFSPRDAARRLVQRNLLHERVLSPSSIATLAVGPRHWLHWYKRDLQASFMLATVHEEQHPVPAHYLPVAKIARFVTEDEVDQGKKIDYLFVKYAPGGTAQMHEATKHFSAQLMVNVVGDVFLTDVANLACTAITMFVSVDGGQKWKDYQAERSIQDFHVGRSGEIAVTSNGFAALIDPIDLRRKIKDREPAFQKEKSGMIKVDKGDVLARFDLLPDTKEDAGEETGNIAIYSPTRGKTTVFNHLGRPIREMVTADFVASSLEGNGRLIFVSPPTPMSGVRRITRRGTVDEFTKLG